MVVSRIWWFDLTLGCLFLAGCRACGGLREGGGRVGVEMGCDREHNGRRVGGFVTIVALLD